jgi:hypothetical protein
MTYSKLVRNAAISLMLVLAALTTWAQGAASPKEGSWIVRDFKFHTGQVLPDAIGTGKSTKPSDGLRAAFPKYNYDDMVC